MAKMSRTGNGAVQYASTYDKYLEFFSKAGSAFVRKPKPNAKGTRSVGTQSALELFKAMWATAKKEDLEKIAFQLLVWCRDARGGAGNRSGPREIWKWLGDTSPEWVIANIDLVAEFGRWDDYVALYGTKAQTAALDAWAKGILAGNGLACKWAGRKDYVLRGHMGLRPKEYRQMLVAGTTVVETVMCQKKWDAIEFSKVPSVAMSRYAKAFSRNCGDLFVSFKTKVEKGEAKVNASALFPHDLVRACRSGDKQMADLQWDSLPDFIGGTDLRIMALADTSGSMSHGLDGTIQPVDISQALALYCSDKVGKDNPFYRKYMQFCAEASLTDWTGKKLSEVVDNHHYFNEAVGNTDISKALFTLLKLGTLWLVPADKMPNVLLIISDMQFDQGVVRNHTPVEVELKKWEAAGYDVPKVVYWNVVAHAGSPATGNDKNVGLVSGFSPSILKSVLSGKDFSPIGIMLEAIAKYDPVVQTPTGA